MSPTAQPSQGEAQDGREKRKTSRHFKMTTAEHNQAQGLSEQTGPATTHPGGQPKSDLMRLKETPMGTGQLSGRTQLKPVLLTQPDSDESESQHGTLTLSRALFFPLPCFIECAQPPAVSSYYPLFIDKDISTEKFSNFPKDTQQVKSRTRIQAQAA